MFSPVKVKSITPVASHAYGSSAQKGRHSPSSFMLLVLDRIPGGMLGTRRSAAPAAPTAPETQYVAPLSGLAVRPLVPAGRARPLLAVRAAADNGHLVGHRAHAKEHEVVENEEGPGADGEEAEEQLRATTSASQQDEEPGAGRGRGAPSRGKKWGRRVRRGRRTKRRTSQVSSTARLAGRRENIDMLRKIAPARGHEAVARGRGIRRSYRAPARARSKDVAVLFGLYGDGYATTR